MMAADKMPAVKPACIHSRSRGSQRAYFDTAASFGSRKYRTTPLSNFTLKSRDCQPSGKRAALAELLLEIEDAARIVPGVRVDVVRHRHARGQLAIERYAEHGVAPDHDEFRMVDELPRSFKELLKILYVHRKDQGEFWYIAFSHSPKDVMAKATPRGSSDKAFLQPSM
jgi:hypothetical protein